jgi:4-diphosphocytidyl-2-C-methyl-D-erythritol kinase
MTSVRPLTRVFRRLNERLSVSPMSFQVLAPAKLNLYLNIVGRRDDGYHLLDSLFAFVELADEILIETAPKPSIHVRGEFAFGLDGGEANLVAKARDLVFAEAGVSPSLAITLDKRIPVAAGLGGGSADAAATLVALNSYLDLGWSMDRLMPMAAALGADVPACLESRAVIAGGIGDALSAAPNMPACGVLLVNPQVPTPTPAVFKAFRGANTTLPQTLFLPLPETFADVSVLVRSIQPRGNDLLPAALTVTPVIDAVLGVLRSLDGALHVGLSGSGATCFALFASETEALWARTSIEERMPDWWSWAGGWAEPR